MWLANERERTWGSGRNKKNRNYVLFCFYVQKWFWSSTKASGKERENRKRKRQRPTQRQTTRFHTTLRIPYIVRTFGNVTRTVVTIINGYVSLPFRRPPLHGTCWRTVRSVSKSETLCENAQTRMIMCEDLICLIYRARVAQRVPVANGRRVFSPINTIRAVLITFLYCFFLSVFRSTCTTTNRRTGIKVLRK